MLTGWAGEVKQRAHYLPLAGTISRAQLKRIDDSSFVVFVSSTNIVLVGRVCIRFCVFVGGCVVVSVEPSLGYKFIRVGPRSFIPSCRPMVDTDQCLQNDQVERSVRSGSRYPKSKNSLLKDKKQKGGETMKRTKCQGKNKTHFVPEQATGPECLR